MFLVLIGMDQKQQDKLKHCLLIQIFYIRMVEDNPCKSFNFWKA
jgi:hypothetical protein